MKRTELGDCFEWEGQIVRVEWINPGEKSIGFAVKKSVICPHCDKPHEIIEGYDVIESSPHFQGTAKLIKTLIDK